MGPVRQNPIQRTVSLFICVCSSLCTIVAHNIAQNRPDNFPSCPPENHHCSDDVYLRKRVFLTRKYTVRVWGLLDLWLPAPEIYNKQNTVYSIYADTIRYDTLHYIYMYPKLTYSMINRPYGTNKHKEGNGIKLKSPIKSPWSQSWGRKEDLWWERFVKEI